MSKAEKDLADALKNLADLRKIAGDSQNDLAKIQWNLDLALNKLYVAQARKEAADRSSAIALAEGSFSVLNVNNGVSTIGASGYANFAGCASNNYPPISGTSKVVNVLKGGYTVESGHTVSYGSCSSA